MPSQPRHGYYSIKKNVLTLNEIQLDDLSEDDLNEICSEITKEKIENATIKFDSGNVLSIHKEGDQLVIALEPS